VWLGVLVVWVTVPAAWALRLDPYGELLAVEVMADGLQEPVGMAVDPVSDVLFVAERQAGQIAQIRYRVAIPMVTNGFTVEAVPLNWAISSQRPEEQWRAGALQKPETIHFGPDGRLYVAERGGGGRLLRFNRMEDQFVGAELLISPWLETSLGYNGVAVDASGQVLAGMQRATDNPVLPFGRILMRDGRQDWFLVDYGPFADFSPLAMSPDRRTLVFAEHRTGDVTWYDISRQMLFAVMERVQGVRHVAVEASGRTIASVQHRDGTWSIIQVDPLHGRLWEWVGGLSEVGGLTAHPENGDVYVSLVEEGKVLRVYHLEPQAQVDEMDELETLLLRFEMEHALAPREWPDFFRSFIEHLDMVDAVDHMIQSRARWKSAVGGKVPMSVEEFASAIPVVAAKVQARLLSPSVLEPDPIEELNFVLFFPNQSVQTRQTVAPSISLLQARRRSGKEIRTQFMPNEHGAPLTEDLDWDDLPEVLISFPTGYHARRTSAADEDLVRVYFLGMGLGPDYWIDVHRDDPAQSKMVIEDPFGPDLEYALDLLPERASAGGKSLLVAGLTEIDKGWEFIGKKPVMWSLVLDEETVLKTRNMDRMQREAWHQLSRPAQPAKVDENEPLPDEELTFRRALVLRAASRWREIAFEESAE
jgi:hypothetical protein